MTLKGDLKLEKERKREHLKWKIAANVAIPLLLSITSLSHVIKEKNPNLDRDDDDEEEEEEEVERGN